MILGDVTHQSEQTGRGQYGCFVSGVSFALLSWPNISPSAIISCREVQSSVTRASSASCFGTVFPWVLLLGRISRSHVGYSAISAVVGVTRSSELGMNYHGARVATVTALT